MSEEPRTLTDEWRDTRATVLERDDHQCQHCGVTEAEWRRRYNRELVVHHLVPHHMFDDDEVADHPSNLVTLCSACHGTLEAETRRMFSRSTRIYDGDAHAALVTQFEELTGLSYETLSRGELADVAKEAIKRRARV